MVNLWRSINAADLVRRYGVGEPLQKTVVSSIFGYFQDYFGLNPTEDASGPVRDGEGAAVVVDAAADFLAGFAGRLFPNEPLKILPFFVFLSPLPIIITLNK